MDYIKDNSFKYGTFLLAGILLLAFVLRVWGISYGMPYPYNLDEKFLVNHSLAFGTGDLNPHVFDWPGTLLMYVLFVIFVFYFLAGYFTGNFISTEDFAISFISDPTNFYLISRCFTVLISTLTVYVTYYIGKKIYNSRTTGLIAALFLAVSPLVTGIAHFTLTDTHLTLIPVLSFIYIYQIVKAGKSKYYFFSGLLMGLGMSIKYNAAALIVPILTAHILNVIHNNPGFLKIVFHKGILLLFFSVVQGFIVGCPFSIIDYSAFYHDILFDISRVTEMGNINAEYTSPFMFYIKVALAKGIGIAITVICFIGVVYAIYRRNSANILSLSFIIFYFAYISSWKVSIDKYLLPIIPFIIINGAMFLTFIYNKYASNVKYGRIFFVIGIFIIIAYPLKRSIIIDIALTNSDTRSLAKEWIENNIPGGTKIAIDSGRVDIAKFSPPINDTPENYYNTFIVKAKSGDNKYLKSGEEMFNKYFQLLNKIPVKISYPLTRIVLSSYGEIDKNISLQRFMDNGVRYVVVSSYAYEGYLSDTYKSNHPEAAEYYTEFYQSINEECILINEFPSEVGKRLGPTIKIYKIPYEESKR
ncbi:4-amino-4-deoxy-L-arabinose transferase and related glycosyltransferases of PMT family [Candidatus Scalindua japonica]|uniref:4-amino-4-deoxy-L-arabinose transferase and related glycosyltransferases of PMT family n=1 Tax=Candidatus Scalindua japonica TaxID=1284222 RepID=A0A286TTK5_9BACT|nr:glycosyltransferase family 39 protein [Candidatus Scalindua japonica]GAX59193.1 4-amino-4-deoxy-L-arabinose transferase and related glycosyltransferases of PMT family [Candidatus Scalindua japonica]